MSESVMYRPQTKALLVIELQHYFTQSDPTFARLTKYNHDWLSIGVLKIKKPGSMIASMLMRCGGSVQQDF